MPRKNLRNTSTNRFELPQKMSILASETLTHSSMNKLLKTISVIFLTILTIMALTSCGPALDQTAKPTKGEQYAALTTNQGLIKVRFFAEQAPETVKNFTELAKASKYDGTIFHRVIKDFMIQGGDFTDRNGLGGHSYKGPGTTIDLETDKRLTHIQGAVAMARKGNDVNSNGSQFFIVTPENGAHFLDNQYTVFGQVFEGMDVAKKIEATETVPGDKPTTDQVVQKVEILEMK